ncbi:MAG: hypothetical protein ACOYK8_03765 [Alphaproteobacteria bacterium]
MNKSVYALIIICAFIAISYNVLTDKKQEKIDQLVNSAEQKRRQVDRVGADQTPTTGNLASTIQKKSGVAGSNTKGQDNGPAQLDFVLSDVDYEFLCKKRIASLVTTLVPEFFQDFSPKSDVFNNVPSSIEPDFLYHATKVREKILGITKDKEIIIGFTLSNATVASPRYVVMVSCTLDAGDVGATQDKTLVSSKLRVNMLKKERREAMFIEH